MKELQEGWELFSVEGEIRFMSEDSEKEKDLTDLSDEVLEDLAHEFTEAIPEALGKAMRG